MRFNIFQRSEAGYLFPMAKLFWSDLEWNHQPRYCKRAIWSCFQWKDDVCKSFCCPEVGSNLSIFWTDITWQEYSLTHHFHWKWKCHQPCYLHCIEGKASEMIFAKCCWTTKGLSAAGMSTLLETNFPRVATRSYLVLIEFIFTIICDTIITIISNSITTIDKLKIEESERSCYMCDMCEICDMCDMCDMWHVWHTWHVWHMWQYHMCALSYPVCHSLTLSPHFPWSKLCRRKS